MKKYEFVLLNGNQFFGAKYEKHREIINEYAKKGYRYVGYVPSQIGGQGDMFEIDLVFEIDED